MGGLTEEFCLTPDLTALHRRDQAVLPLDLEDDVVGILVVGFLVFRPFTAAIIVRIHADAINDVPLIEAPIFERCSIERVVWYSMNEIRHQFIEPCRQTPARLAKALDREGSRGELSLRLSGAIAYYRPDNAGSSIIDSR